VDTWKFYGITHTDHVVLNPTSPARLDELIGLLDLPPEPRVLDIACGTGELLVRLAETHGANGSNGTGTSGDSGSGAGFSGVGVDTSPWFLARARESVARRVPGAAIELLEMDGADYEPEADSFDLACCLGASWVFGGHRGTLRALSHAVRPGGLVLVGEPFWQTEPAAEYLAWSELARDDFASHTENVAIGESEGLVPLLAWVSSGADWDRYETLQWRAAARFAAANPGDPDVPELLKRVAHARHEYLAWGRTTLGWALYLFDQPASVPGA
jgi:SAM-dependent methyltransferase